MDTTGGHKRIFHGRTSPKEFIGEVVFQLAMRVAASLGLSLVLELWRHEREMSSDGTKPGLPLECQSEQTIAHR